MLSYRFLTQRARTLLLACALSATMIAMSAPEAQANEVAQDNPFAHIESFANEIKDYVGAVADGAAERAAEEERAIRRQSVVDEAASHLGVPYVYGGTTPAGFDCSGFTRWVFEHALGVALPRTAAEQSALGEVACTTWASTSATASTSTPPRAAAALCGPPSITSPPPSPSASWPKGSEGRSASPVGSRSRLCFPILSPLISEKSHPRKNIIGGIRRGNKGCLSWKFQAKCQISNGFVTVLPHCSSMPSAKHRPNEMFSQVGQRKKSRYNAYFKAPACLGFAYPDSWGLRSP